MSEESLKHSEREIDNSLQLCKFCMRQIGISFEPPRTAAVSLRHKMILAISVVSICYHVFGDIVFIGITMANLPQLEDVIPYFHTFGYGVLSVSKVFVLWYKKDVFSRLIRELVEIWPVSPLDEEVQDIKNTSLNGLRITSMWYFSINAIGVWFYNLTPIATAFFYQRRQGHNDAQVGFIWASWYPFDKHHPIGHVVAYIFEMFIGVTCVWIMTGTDLLFSTLASHICLLLRLLQRRLEAMAASEHVATGAQYYREIVENIKLHQRLIKYCEDLEEAFSVSNLLNYVLSSVNICCAVFLVVFFDPFLALGNKLFIISALIQIGMICWYGDDILRANADISNAAYNSGWYQMDLKSRRALLFLLYRSQKPVAFTAMKFTTISLKTYSTILRRSYSYFALLYTIYAEK